MTEQITDQLFAQIDALGPDASLLRAMEQSREIEDLLNADGIDHTDELTEMTVNDLLKEAITKMDAECPHLFEQVFVTGVLKRAYFNDLSQKFEIEDIEVNRQQLTSYGYGILEFNPDGDDRTIKKVGHLFLVETMPPSNDAPPLVDYVQRLFAFAPTGLVEIEHDMSNEANIAFVQKHIPDILDEIDGLIFNAPDECASLLLMADVVIGREQDIPDEVLSGLVSYVRHRLSLETTLPYIIQVDGAAYDTSGDQLELNVYRDAGADKGLVGYFSDLSLRPYPEVSDRAVSLSDDLHWCIDIAVLGKNSQDRVAMLSVPIENMLSMRSVRDMLYDN